MEKPLRKKDQRLLCSLINQQIRWYESAIRSIENDNSDFFVKLKTKHQNKIREFEKILDRLVT